MDILKIKDELNKNNREYYNSSLLFIDFKSAIDSVSHELIFK
jgi:hypothetical protein